MYVYIYTMYIQVNTSVNLMATQINIQVALLCVFPLLEY